MVREFHVWCPGCGRQDYICAASAQEAEDALEHRGRCTVEAIAQLKKPLLPPRLP